MGRYEPDEGTEDQDVAVTAEAEPDEPEPDEDEDEDEDEPEPTEPTEPNSDTARAAIDAYAVRARKYLAKNMGEVFGDAATEFTECPFCNFTQSPGFVHMSPCPPELLGVVLEWTNAARPDDLNADPHAQECPECSGYGKTRMPTKVPEQEQASCVRCQGKGWLATDAERGGLPSVAANGPAPAYPPPSPAASALPSIPAEDDPRVAELRAAGYMVVPLPAVQA